MCLNNSPKARKSLQFLELNNVNMYIDLKLDLSSENDAKENGIARITQMFPHNHSPDFYHVPGVWSMVCMLTGPHKNNAC